MSKWRPGKYGYVEDSTRGKARSEPKSYKGDTPVQVWLDRRKIAAVSEYLDRLNPGMIRFLSDVLRTVFDIAYEELSSKGLTREFDVVEAGMYLMMKFKKDPNPCGKGLRNLNHNLILEERIREQALGYRTPAVTTYGNTCKVSPDDPLVQVALRAKEQVHKMAEMTKMQVEEKVTKSKFNPEFCDENGNLDMEKVKASRAKNALAQNAVVEQMKRNRAQALLNEQEERERLKALRSEQKIKEKIEVLKAKLGKESDQPRAKTEEEIEEDYKRIESKDRALLAALDAPAPKPTDD